MDKKRYPLTPEVQQHIMASIRAGCYAHVAAEAWGIPRQVFEGLLRRGRRKNAVEPYLTFAGEVRAAVAQARLRAEMAAYNQDPTAWLEHGPGREAPDNPGWTGTVKAPALDGTAASNLLLRADVMDLGQVLLRVLIPFPEARVHVADALAIWKKPKRDRPSRP